MLSIHEFKKLSQQERCERYKELSDHDKFIARVYLSEPGSTLPDDFRPATEEEQIAHLEQVEQAFGLDFSEEIRQLRDKIAHR